MIYEFENLTKEEQDMILKAPALIAVLVAGVDDVIESRELKRAVELVNIKTFSEKQAYRYNRGSNRYYVFGQNECKIKSRSFW